MLRILFLGTPEFAVRSLDALLSSSHQVVGVLTQPDRPRGRGHRVSASPVKARAEAAAIPVWQPDRLREEALLEPLRDLRPDLGVVAAYGKLLPDVLLQLPRLGMVNVHASLLPRHRGASPIQRAILDGDTQTGVTIMRVVKALDAGGMLAHAATPIDVDETAVMLEARLARMGASLLVDTLGAIERGTATETPQDESLVTYAGRIGKGDGLIDWEASGGRVHDMVRGLTPWPHAFTFHGALRLVVHETRAYPSLAAAWQGAGAVLDHAVANRVPGTVLPAPRGHLFLAAGEGTVVDILRLQEEGRRIVTAREFLAGRSLAPGSRFSAFGSA